MAHGATLLAACLVGLLTGAMLLIAVSLAPYWVSLEPPEISASFAATAPWIGRLMVPLGVGATLSTVIAASLGVGGQRAEWPRLVGAAALMVFVAAIYPLYYTAANAALASGGGTPAEIGAELARWRLWHWLRLAAGLLAFLALLRACVLQGGAA